jgi:dienelactone hydrolase
MGLEIASRDQRITKMRILIEKGSADSIPFLSLVPENAQNTPVIFYVPGYGLGKESGLSLGYRLAQAGFAFISPDPLYHGERYQQLLDHAHQPELGGIYPPETGLDTARVFFRAIAHSLDDIKSLIDHFSEDSRFDVQNCGVTGPSMGGCASFLAFANLPEIKAAVPMIGLPNFTKRWKDLLDETAFSDPEWARGLENQMEETREFTAFVQGVDPYSKLLLIDNKALLIMNCDFDSDQPKIYSIDLYREMLPNYQDQPGKLRLRIYPFGHQVTPEMEADAVNWFQQHLQD